MWFNVHEIKSAALGPIPCKQSGIFLHLLTPKSHIFRYILAFTLGIGLAQDYEIEQGQDSTIDATRKPFHSRFLLPWITILLKIALY